MTATSIQPGFQVARGDAVDWLRTLPTGAVDLLITDPPYESLEKHRAIGTTTRLLVAGGQLGLAM